MRVFRRSFRSSFPPILAGVAGVLLVGCRKEPLAPVLAPRLNVVWSHHIFSTSFGPSNTTPATDGVRVFLVSNPISGGTVIDAFTDSTRAVWADTLNGSFAVPNNLIAAHGDVLGAIGSTVYAWNGATGAIVWVSSLPINVTDVLATADSTAIYLAGGTTVTAISLADGSLLWSTDVRGTDYTSGKVRGVVAFGDTVYANAVQSPAGSGGWYYGLSRKTGAILWHFRDAGGMGSPTTTPAVSARYLVSVDSGGEVVAIDRLSAQVAWRTPTTTRGGVAGPPVIVDSTVYVATQFGASAAMALSLSTGAVRWSAPIDVFTPSFAVCHNTIVLGTRTLTVLNPVTGTSFGNAFDPTSPEAPYWTPVTRLASVNGFLMFANSESVYLIRCD